MAAPIPSSARRVAVIPCFSADAADRIRILAERLAELGWDVRLVANSSALACSVPAIANGKLGITAIYPHSNLGFGGAANLAFDDDFDVGLIVNDDVFLGDLSNDDLHRGILLLQCGAGAVSLSSDVDHLRVGPSSTTEIWLKVSSLWAIRQRLLQSRRSAFDFSLVLVDGTAWRQCGGFDTTNFPLYYEDSELLHRLAAAGYLPSSIRTNVRHIGSATASRHPEAVALHAIGAVSYLQIVVGTSRFSARALVRSALVPGIAINLGRRRLQDARMQWRLLTKRSGKWPKELPPYERG